MKCWCEHQNVDSCCLRRVFHQLQLRGDQQDLRSVLGRDVPRCGQQLRRGRGGRACRRRIASRPTSTSLAVAPPPAMAVAPRRKFVVNVPVHLLRPSVRQHSLRTSRTPAYETYDHPYVKLDVVRVVRRTTSRCFTYGPS